MKRDEWSEEVWVAVIITILAGFILLVTASEWAQQWPDHVGAVVAVCESADLPVELHETWYGYRARCGGVK
jgi:hypothetical protein